MFPLSDMVSLCLSCGVSELFSTCMSSEHEPKKFGNPPCIHLRSTCVRWASLLKICYLRKNNNFLFEKYFFGGFQAGMSDPRNTEQLKIINWLKWGVDTVLIKYFKK